MTWQDELRQLDEDLTAGRVSADDYRRRRDELTARESQAAPEQQTQSDDAAPAAPTPEVPADSQTIIAQSVKSPFPPAFRWETAPPDSPETSETTQIIRPGQEGQSGQSDESAGDDSNTPTQVVQAGQFGDSESTQVLQSGTPQGQQYAPPTQQQPISPPGGAFPPSPPGGAFPPPGQGGGFPPGGAGVTQQVPQWGFQQDASAPPWAGSDLPPLPDQQNPWARQGPEGYSGSGGSGRGLRIFGVVLVIVLLIGLITVGVVFFLNRDTEAEPTNPPAPPQNTQSTVALPAPPEPSPPPADATQALIDPPGTVRGGGGLLDLARLENGDLVQAPIVDALRTAEMTDGVLKTTTTDEDVTISMFAFTVRDEDAASDVSETISTVQRDGGLREDRERALQGVDVFNTGENAETGFVRATYVLYNRAIFIEVFGPNTSNVMDTFDEVLDDQVQQAPPTVR